jgi:hypothetical protein
MDYAEAKVLREIAYSDMDIASTELQKFPTGVMGLTPDDVKNSLEFRVAQANFDASFKNVRHINSIINKYFKKEYNEDRHNRKFAV